MAIQHLKKEAPFSFETLFILNNLINIFSKKIQVLLDVTSLRLVNNGHFEGS